MKILKNSLLISSTFVATVIGAGFASGQELLSYFVIYGKNSIFGLFIMSALFSACSLFVMLRIDKDSLDSFDEYVNKISGKHTGIFIKACVFLFMFASFCSMAAGSSELFFSALSLDKSIGIAVMLTACFIILLFDLKGILAINSILAPIMSISLFFLGIYTFIFRNTAVFQSSTINHLCKNYLTSSVIYASYNTLTTVVILSETKNLIFKKKVCYISSFLGGGALLIISVAMWASLMLYYGKIPLYSIPFLTLSARHGSLFKLLYGIILYLSMFTTAVSCGYGTVKWLKEKLKIKRLTAIILTIALSLPVIFLGFEDIIKKIYSGFGYLGLVLIVLILTDGVHLMTKKD